GLSPLVLLFSLRRPAPPHSCPLSLHDALPILRWQGLATDAQFLDTVQLAVDRDARYALTQLSMGARTARTSLRAALFGAGAQFEDRKSTRLNSSHVKISYAVFCLKKKKPADTPFCPRIVRAVGISRVIRLITINKISL